MTDIDRDLRELRQSAPPPDCLDAVRARVLERIADQERFRWGGWLVGLASGLLLAFSLWSAKAPPAQRLEFAWNPPAAPESAFRIPEKPKRRVRRELPAAPPSREIRVVAWTESTPEQPGSTLLELPSTDENVLLYFVADPQGD